MRLREGEKIILDDGNAGFRKKLTLTNQRLIYTKKEGVFKTFLRVIEEIPLEQIEEAYTKTIGNEVQASVAMLKMKDGQNRGLNIGVGVEFRFENFFAINAISNHAIKTKALSDKWVNAINQQLRKMAENRTERLEEKTRDLEEKLKEKGK